jgi:hypothetical protein
MVCCVYEWIKAGFDKGAGRRPVLRKIEDMERYAGPTAIWSEFRNRFADRAK